MPVLVTVIHHSVFGGPHNQILRLSGPLSRRNWQTAVVLPEGPGNAAERLSAAGIRVVQIPLHRPRKSLHPGSHLGLALSLLPEIAELRKIIRNEGADVVQVFGPMYPHGAVAGRLEGIPVVWQLLGTFAPGLIRTIMMPAVLCLSDVVMTTGMGVANAHPGATKLGNRLVTFFPPVDTHEFRPDPIRRRLARQELGVSPGNLLIGTVGNLNRVKGHDLLVRAASQVQQSCPEVSFRILGTSSSTQVEYYEAHVKKVAEKLGLVKDGTLRFVDPGSRVPELLPAFDIFVLSSRAEGIPTSLLEAMSCGLPVVAPEVGSINEVIENGVNGLLVQPLHVGKLADAVLELVRNSDLRARMSVASRCTAVECYSTKVCVEAHLHAYEMALARRGSAHLNPAVNNHLSSRLDEEKSPEFRAT